MSSSGFSSHVSESDDVCAVLPSSFFGERGFEELFLLIREGVFFSKLVVLFGLEVPLLGALSLVLALSTANLEEQVVLF